MPLKQSKRKQEEKQNKNQISVAVVPEMISATTNLGKGEIEVPKEIKDIEALIFSRGRLNAQFFRGNKDRYVVPSWVERMLSYDSPGVISLGHSSSFINSNYRNWVAFGGIDCYSEGIVTDMGLIVPEIDGYGILTGAIVDDQVFYCSRDGTNKQTLQDGYLPIIHNEWTINKQKFHQVVYGGLTDTSETGVATIEKEENSDSNLVISIRPFNQEGVSLIKAISYHPRNQTIFINKKPTLKLKQKPQKIAVASYNINGDSAVKLVDLAMDYDSQKEISIECIVGLANMTFVFPKEEQTIEVSFRMTDSNVISSLSLAFIETQWKEKIASGMTLSTKNKEVDRLYKASIANLLLLTDPGTITPGPTEYHRFWCRDAAYLISALDRAGFHDYARDALNQFIVRQRSDGFYYSHEGEFDSNGEGIWALAEHAKLTQDYQWLEGVYESIEKAAEWIITTRKLEKKEGAIGKEEFIRGLLPPGFSAEHLGPCDYFYWDNFWGVTGLREAAHIARILQKESATRLQKEFERYLLDLFISTSKLFKKYDYLPVGPFREIDSAMIANLCAYHPTKIWDSSNEILTKTADLIYNKFTHKGGFFHEVAWNCYGTYLTMHLAQIYHDRNDQEKVWEILQWLIKYQTCVMGWAEGISPQTMEGGMGDSAHGWASADWVHLLRNLFCSETLDGTLKLLSGMPIQFLKKGVSVKNLRTYYGNLSYSAKWSKNTLTLKISNDISLPTYKIMTPTLVTKVSVDKGDAMIIDSQCVGVSTKAKKITIELE